MYEDLPYKEARAEVIKRLPKLHKLDGVCCAHVLCDSHFCASLHAFL
jgi:hypothetical protein